MTEVIGEKWGTCDSFPKKLIIDKVEITDTKTIAKTFNNFFVKIGPNPALEIPKIDTNFETYISKANTKLQENVLTEDAFCKTFKSLKINKAPSFDEIDVNVINQIYNHIKKPLNRIFGNPIKPGVFPGKLKLAKVTPIFKSGKNWLYEYGTKNNLMFDKQFVFRKVNEPNMN